MTRVEQIAHLNFRMRALEDGQTFLAVWTAPGDDYDHGSVTGYKFVYSSNISALLDADSEAETLLQFQRPDPAGVQTSYQFEFEHYNRDYFLGLVAFDERSNEGKLKDEIRIRVLYEPDKPKKKPENFGGK